VRDVAARSVFMSKEVADERELAAVAGKPVTTPTVHLSPRERQVLTGIADGLTLKQIANRLGPELTAVTSYVERIKEKMGRTSLAGLVRKGHEEGLLESPTRCGLGCATRSIDSAEAAGIHALPPTTRGAIVVRVDTNDLADRAGLRRGEVIVSLDGEAVGSATGLETAVAAREAGSVIRVGVLSTNGEGPRTVKITLGNRPRRHT